MITVNTVQSSTPTGAGKITAKAMGKQRTVRVDHSRSVEQNHGAAAGTLLHVLLTPEQRAMLLHPTGRQRVRMESTSDAGGRWRVTVDV